MTFTKFIKDLEPIKFNGKIKIAWHSNSPFLWTGYAKVTREFCLRLAKDPLFDVHILAQGFGGEPEEFHGCKVYPVKHDKHQLNVGKQIQKWLDKIKPDVLISLEDTFSQTLYGFPNLNLGRTKLILYTPLDGGYIPYVGHQTLRMADRIFAMSKFTQKALLKEGFESDLLYHGVDLFQFKPLDPEIRRVKRAKLGVSDEDIMIFTFSRNSLRKHLPETFEAVALACKANPKIKFFAHILNPKNMDSNIEDMVKRIIKDKVGVDLLDKQIFITDGKPVPDDKVADIVAASDLTINLSSGEGFGMLMTESMACGVPCVHSEYTTSNELLIQPVFGIGLRGVTIPPSLTHVSSFNTEHGFHSPRKASEEILKLVEDKELMKKMGANGRLFVSKLCNWDYLTLRLREGILRTV